VEIVLDMPTQVDCLWMDESVALMGTQNPCALCVYNWQPLHPRDVFQVSCRS
jgi:hypothetical protein